MSRTATVAPKYTDAIRAGVQITINGETFGTFTVKGQTVYLSEKLPTIQTETEIIRTGGYFLASEFWSHHRARYERKPLFLAILDQLQTAKIYGAGYYGQQSNRKAAIFETAANGGWGRLREKRRLCVSSDADEVRKWWEKQGETVLEGFISV